MRRAKPPEKTTEQKIKDAAIDLFGKYGYEGATMRMIAAEAGFSAGQITKSFGSKEELFDEIVTDIYNSAVLDYKGIIEEFQALEDAGGCPREKAWELIERIVDTQIDFAFSEDSRSRVKIFGLRQPNVENVHTQKLSQIAKEQIEITMADLFRVIFKQKRRLHLMTISRAVNGCIMSFAQDPELLLEEVLASRYMPSSVVWLRSYLKNYIMDSIHMEAEREERRYE